jgi:enoyl-CoA hydratase/carnithine racemase
VPRFRVSRAGDTVRIEFDDGGMNLLSSDALRELEHVIPSEVEGSGRVGRAARPTRPDASTHARHDKLLTFASVRPNLFAAGADMAEMQRFTGHDAEEFARLGQELFARIERLPMITVALIDGDCFGGALDLALAFDFRFATPRSRFAHPGSRIGIVTGFGGTSRWRKVLSRPAANQLFLANRVLAADEALRVGLVDRVAESHDDELARLAALDPVTVRMVKELTMYSERLSRRELAVLAARLDAVYRR